MTNLESLKVIVEDCLKREGLYSLIPEDRRESIFTFSFGAYGWFIFLWIAQIYFILETTNFENWLVALLFTPILILISIILMIICFGVLAFRRGKTFDLSKYASTIGGFYLLIFPLVISIGTGIYLSSLKIPLYMVIISIIGGILFVILYTQKYRIHLFAEFIKSIIKVLVKSAGKIIILVPVLLIIVLLSIFSGELWESVGNLSLLRLIGSTTLIIFPIALLIYSSLNITANQITGNLLIADEIIKTAKHHPVIQTKLLRGLISPEEWTEAIEELSWRDKDKLANHLLPIVQRKVKHWLAIFLIVTTIIVSFSFFLYFCSFFYILLKPEIISAWVKIPNDTPFYTWTLFQPTESNPQLNSITLSINNTIYPIIKVSTLLSVFIALASNVYALTDDSALNRLTGWLKEKAGQWLALGYIYDGLVCPNYQIWKYTNEDKKRGIVNVSIIVPSNSTDESVELACKHLDQRLDIYKTNVIIRAFEQNTTTPIYEYWSVNKFWEFIHNKITTNEFFTPVDNSYEEIRSNHFLGIQNLEKAEPIPDEWFGNTANATDISKTIWENDLEIGILLHPYTNLNDKTMIIDIRLKKKMAESENYRQFIKKILEMVLEKEPNIADISIILNFRETGDVLASFWLIKAVDYISYRDEIKGESKKEKIQNWI